MEWKFGVKKSGEEPTNCKNKYFNFSLSISRKKRSYQRSAGGKMTSFSVLFQIVIFFGKPTKQERWWQNDGIVDALLEDLRGSNGAKDEVKQARLTTN